MASDRRNVVLTGFMGTGKTTVGRALASRVGYEFVDTDHVIEAEHGPISLIFSEHGEGVFRQFERDVADRLAAREGLVIGTGGRLMLDAVNAARLSATGDVFCLVASLETVLTRVDADGAGATRPLLAGGDPRQRVPALMNERRDGYARFVQIDTDGLTPDEVVDAIETLRS